MTETATGTATGTATDGVPPADLAQEHDPWAGIPAEVLDPARSYGTDTPGGCG